MAESDCSKDTPPEEKKEPRRPQRTAYWREYNARNRQKVNKKSRDWQARNPETGRAWRAVNRERIKQTGKLWSARNHEKALAKSRAWKARNPEAVRAYNARYPERSREYRLRYPDKAKESGRAWRARNPGLVNARTMRRIAAKLRATPPWADHAAIKAIYVKAAKLGLEADHIVPLQHPKVCGLHVPWNLQLLTRVENARKGNILQEQLL